MSLKYNNPVVTQSDFRQNLAELTKLAKKYSNNIVYIGLTPTDDKVTHPFDNENIFEFAQTKIYNKIIQLHCKNENLLFIQIIDKLTNLDLDDGVHPNSAGHSKIFNTIIPKINNLLLKDPKK